MKPFVFDALAICSTLFRDSNKAASVIVSIVSSTVVFVRLCWIWSGRGVVTWLFEYPLENGAIPAEATWAKFCGSLNEDALEDPDAWSRNNLFILHYKIVSWEMYTNYIYFGKIKKLRTDPPKWPLSLHSTIWRLAGRSNACALDCLEWFCIFKGAVCVRFNPLGVTDELICCYEEIIWKLLFIFKKVENEVWKWYLYSHHVNEGGKKRCKVYSYFEDLHFTFLHLHDDCISTSEIINKLIKMNILHFLIRSLHFWCGFCHTHYFQDNSQKA